MNDRLQNWFLFFVLMMGVSCVVEAATYNVNPQKTSLIVQVFKEKKGHDHVVRATGFSGQVSFDAQTPTATDIQMTVDAGALSVDDADLRKQVGLNEMLTDADRKKVDANMKGDKQLAVSRYPTISFRSTGVRADDSAGHYLLTGDLTIHGITKSVSLPVAVRVDGQTLHGVGELRFKQSDFGITPYSAMMGLFKNQDELVLHIDLYADATS